MVEGVLIATLNKYITGEYPESKGFHFVADTIAKLKQLGVKVKKCKHDIIWANNDSSSQDSGICNICGNLFNNFSGI